MKAPQLAGVVERRLLVNYRADPGVIAGCCPRRCDRSWSMAAPWPASA
jgi:hypothetical protein